MLLTGDELLLVHRDAAAPEVETIGVNGQAVQAIFVPGDGRDAYSRR